ncbi:hypothetical protein FK004_13805 [Flavobacterium kingsejongi]|uniref:Uncharacterized protein n=1 Tax=Flavobacterium kingsejongi TaxID=1678728 RepID=A0A2S1LRG2_9FLAO|nr:hypothetical protein FK004_13805 [Flavobacterium kingsejongi]
MFTESNDEKVSLTYELFKNWCDENSFNYTPILFVNGYSFPRAYDIEYLQYFINDLFEDENIN